MLFDVIERPHVDAQPSPPPILEKIINDSDKNYEQPPQFHRNPVVQKEVASVAHLILQGKDKDIPFTPYLSKSQKKKALKLSCAVMPTTQNSNQPTKIIAPRGSKVWHPNSSDQSIH